MKTRTKKSKKGFTLIELVVVIAILGILAAILVPVISGFIETANQAADNANARLVYQASAMWFASNNTASASLTYTELGPFMGSGTMPTAKSQAFAGAFTSAVAADGTITVRTAKPATYHPSTGKLAAGSTTP
jgi:type IV pilus assembly protein PilA